MLHVSEDPKNASNSDASQGDDLNERILLNVGGKRFETYASTLAQHPDTLLGAMFSSRNRHMRRQDTNGEYFFDRDPVVFPTVLNFHRTGKLFMPPNLNEDLVREELEYFQIPVKEGQNLVFTWGRGEYGQLGHGDRCSLSTPRVIHSLQKYQIRQLSLGTSHSAAITNNEIVFTWGYGGDGRLGHGDEQDQLIPKRMKALDNMHVIQVVCGELHTAALTSTGKVFTWGLGKDGRLGHFNRESHFLPERVKALDGYHVTQVACGGLHTAALTRNGLIFTWGLGKDGRLGHGNERDQLSPKHVEALKQHSICQILCGGHHTAALSERGKVFTWGFDDDGRLGHNCAGHQYYPKCISALEYKKITEIACGCWHSAALSDEGEVFTWGSCKSGQLGQAHKNSVPTPRIVLQGKSGGVIGIACGTAHTAALTANGELYTWGKHDDGRLGYETSSDQTTPRLVQSLIGYRVQQVVCGVYDTAALTI